MKPLPILVAVGSFAVFLAPAADAATVLGTGAAALLGGDLTDPENDGTPAGLNYNAIFDASEEAGFGGGEFAFNVFNNTVGGGNNKWCCGGGSPGVFPIWVDATFPAPVTLGSFTLTNGNDSATRDPQIWQIQGSNDGVTFTNIFSHGAGGASNVFTARNQVILWDATDFTAPAAYTTLRLNVDATGATTGALWQLNEIEYFAAVPEPSSLAFFGLAGLGLILRRRR